MSVAIYYTATRRAALSSAEAAAVQAIKAKYSVNKQIEEYCRTGKGLNWESFTFHDPTPESPAIILQGSTKLPDKTMDAVWVGLQHWCKALTELRLLLPDAEWDIHVDDHPIQWDPKLREYDPSK